MNRQGARSTAKNESCATASEQASTADDVQICQGRSVAPRAHTPLNSRSTAALTFPPVAVSARKFASASKKPISHNWLICDAYRISGATVAAVLATVVPAGGGFMLVSTLVSIALKSAAGGAGGVGAGCWGATGAVGGAVGETGGAAGVAGVVPIAPKKCARVRACMCVYVCACVSACDGSVFGMHILHVHVHVPTMHAVRGQRIARHEDTPPAGGKPPMPRSAGPKPPMGLAPRPPLDAKLPICWNITCCICGSCIICITAGITAGLDMTYTPQRYKQRQLKPVAHEGGAASARVRASWRQRSTRVFK